MKQRVLAWLLASISLTLTLAVKADDFIIVSNGIAQCTIVVPVTNKSEDSWFGACELTNHIFKITGVMVPVALDTNGVSGPVIVVGHSRNFLASMGLAGLTFTSQEYLIHFTNNALALVGSENFGDANAPTWPNLHWEPSTVWDEHGTLYAVYDFLEKYCDVHWYHPGEWGTTFTPTRTLVVRGPGVRRAPAMTYRTASFGYNICDMLSSPTWSVSDSRWSLRNKSGGKNINISHSLNEYYDAYHVAHPEWFARNTNGTALNTGQPCFSSTGFAAQVAADAKRFFDTGVLPAGVYAGDGFFCVTPQDGWGYCDCVLCHPNNASRSGMSCGEVSDNLWRFVDAVARQVQVTNPGKKIACLAYQSYYNLPTNAALLDNLATNIIVGLCPFYNRQWINGIETNSSYYRNEIAQVTNWSTHFRGEINGGWLYPCYPDQGAERSDYNCFPGFFARKHAWEMQYFYTNGWRGINLCGSGELVDGYVLMRYMDDPFQDVEALVTNLFDDMYGPAAAPLRDFYSEAEAVYSNLGNYTNGGFSVSESYVWRYLGSATRMAQWQQYMDQATLLATNDPYQTRVALFTNSIWKYMADGYRRYNIKAAFTNTLVRTGMVAAVTLYQSPTCYDGDISKVNWGAVPPLYANRGVYGYPAEHSAEIRIAHDGSNLYVRVIEDVSGQLMYSIAWRWGDAWEFYFSPSRGTYTAYQAFQPNGLMEKTNFPSINQGPGSIGSTWTMYTTVPLKTVLGHSWTNGNKAYMNFQRGTSQGNQCLNYSPSLSGGWYQYNYNRHAEFVLAAERPGMSYYVDVSNATPQAPYTNWTMAANSIQDAVDLTLINDTVYVAPGVYGTNTRSADATNQVVMAYPINLLATSTHPSETVIDGGGARRGILVAGGGSIRGFTITHCVSDGAAGVSLTGCLIEHCVIAGNLATNGHGGGASVAGGSVMRNCLVIDNVTTNAANDRDGGGAIVQAASVYNSTFAGNYAGRNGSGLVLDLAQYSGTNDIQVMNCIVAGNHGSVTNIGIKRSGSACSIRYTCAPDLTDRVDGNLSRDPMLVSGGYPLTSNSPCVNAGLNQSGMDSETDLAGAPRLQAGTVDMGAYESDSTRLPPLSASVSIAGGNDDVEQLANGSMSMNSSDLELGYDITTAQTVGLRFAGVPVPVRATISAAYIQFMADETNGAATALTIRGEAADHSAAFLTNAWNASGRPVTTAAVSWAPPAWYAVKESAAAQKTGELKALVQEIVNRDGWSAGNAMTFLMTGTGTRTAIAYESSGAGTNPPILVVEWTLDAVPSNDGDADGLPDAWEVNCFGSTGATNGAPLLDADGDGLCNLHEYIAGTDPTNVASEFKLQSSGHEADAQVLRWNSASGRVYSVFCKPDLQAPAWTLLTTNLSSAWPAPNVYTDATAHAEAQRYYRIRVRLAE